jgi:hypothetical protein
MQFFPYYSQPLPTLPIPQPAMSKGKRWTDEERQKVMQLALEGKTPIEMEKDFPGRTAASIQGVMTRAGIKTAKNKAKKDAQKELSKNVGSRSMYIFMCLLLCGLFTYCPL